MRFLVLVKSDNEWNGEPPSAAMGAFNDRLLRDGVLLAAEGLRPSADGARIRYDERRPVVTDGPFAETKELIAGFWILQARSKDELIERFAQCPFERGETLEIRRLFDADDLPDVEQRLSRTRVTAEAPNPSP